MPEAPMQEIVRTGLESVRSHPGGELDGVYIHSDDSPYELAFYQSTRIVAEDGKSKFIKGAVRCVRQSREYKRYLAHLKEDHGMTQCAFQPSIVLDEDVEMEMHHCPLTLYDVCQIILDHILEKGGRCTTLSLADATIHEHFEERIGMVPLTKTAHALVHADHLKIHPRQVYGKMARSPAHLALGGLGQGDGEGHPAPAHHRRGDRAGGVQPVLPPRTLSHNRHTGRDACRDRRHDGVSRHKGGMAWTI